MSRLRVKRPDNIRRPVVVEHIQSGDAEGLTRTQVDNPAHLPAFADSRQGARTVAKQHLTGSDWQCKGSASPEVVRTAVGHQSVVLLPIDRVRKSRSEDTDDRINTKVLTPGVGRLPSDAARRTHRHLRVERGIIVAGVICDPVDGGELRVGRDEIFRQSVYPHYSAIVTGGDRRGV